MRVDAFLACSILIGILFVPTASSGGVYGDDLSKCLVSSTTVADRNFLVKWMFAAMSQHPEVRSMSVVTPEQGEKLSEGTARLFERLLLQSCRAQARAAVQFEGGGTIQAAFSVLGQVAARGLFSDPGVSAFSSKLETYVDQKKLNEALGLK